MSVAAGVASRPHIYLFWDNSNIFVPAKYVAQRREGGFAERDVRIHFRNMYQLAVAGRPLAKAVAVGSVPPEFRKLWDRLQNETGIQIELYERGRSSGTEQAVDEALQVHMLRTLHDVQPPQVAVLLSGDGAGYVSGAGFHADLERMHKAGWGIEVISWDMVCNNALREWARNVGVYVRLEDHYNSVTFLEGIRAPRALSLPHRQYSTPKGAAGAQSPAPAEVQT